MRKLINLPGLIFLAALATVWQIVAVVAASPGFPGFVAVAAALAGDAPAIGGALLVTLGRAFAGFAIALVIALPGGVLLGRVRGLRALAEPVIELIRPLPAIAVIPLAMIFFGIGSTAKIAVVVYGAAFPILINAMEAVGGSHPMLATMARSYGLSRFAIMREIDLPAALPQVVAGIRISLALSVLLGVVSEMILSSDGLGTYLVRAQQNFQIARVLAALLVIALTALAVNAAMGAAERRLLAWHHGRQAGGGAR
ncbi:MAG: ABC transporter permease [Rhodospirillales bacterium]|nr:ABC transporter permease [Rhodospirillales bacterium]